MATRMTSPFAGLGWLKNAINLGSRNPKAVFGGAALLLVAVLVPSLVTTPIQLMMPQSLSVLVGVMLFSFAFGLLLAPVMGGFLRLIHAVENDRPASATDVFAPYRSGGGAIRIIGLAIAFLLVYVVAVVLIVAIAALAFPDLAAAIMASDKTRVSALPAGFWVLFSFIGLVAVLISSMFAISYGQVAVGGRGIFSALGDAVAGTFKNIVPLLVLLVALMLVSIAMLLLFGLLAFFFAMIAKIAGPWLMIAMLLPLYFALMVGMYVVMFGLGYFLWRDVCGGDVATSTPAMAA